MNKTEFTPGDFKGTPAPWNLNGYEYDMGRHVYSIQGGTHTVTMPDGSKQQPTIGMIRFRGTYMHNVVLDENGQSDMINQSEVGHLANAKLIAAAPELLKALQSILNNNDLPNDTMSQKMNIINARKAINKALNR